MACISGTPSSAYGSILDVFTISIHLPCSHYLVVKHLRYFRRTDKTRIFADKDIGWFLYSCVLSDFAYLSPCRSTLPTEPITAL